MDPITLRVIVELAATARRNRLPVDVYDTLLPALHQAGARTGTGGLYGTNRGLFSALAGARTTQQRHRNWASYHEIVCAYTTYGRHAYRRYGDGCDCEWCGGSGDPWGTVPGCGCPQCV